MLCMCACGCSKWWWQPKIGPAARHKFYMQFSNHFVSTLDSEEERDGRALPVIKMGDKLYFKYWLSYIYMYSQNNMLKATRLRSKIKSHG